jgi:hypothetical protein
MTPCSVTAKLRLLRSQSEKPISFLYFLTSSLEDKPAAKEYLETGNCFKDKATPKSNETFSQARLDSLVVRGQKTLLETPGLGEFLSQRTVENLKLTSPI